MNKIQLFISMLFVVLMSRGSFCYAQIVIPLEKLFEMADSNSKQLQPKLTSEEEIKNVIKTHQSSLSPDINISLAVSYLGDGFTTKRDFSDFQIAEIPHLGNNLAVTITQPIYMGGAITNAIDISKMQLTCARYATELQKDNIRIQLTGYYLDMYKYINIKNVIENNILTAEKVLEEIKTRRDQGVAIDNDITRYELLISQLRLQLTKTSNIIDILNTNIVTITGLPAGTQILPDSTLLTNSFPINTLEWWQQEAQKNSNLLNIARTEININKKNENIARSELIPKIALQAGYNIDGPILTEIPPINRNLSYWYIGIGVNYNLSSLYKSNKALKRTEFTTQKSKETYDAMEEEIFLSIKSDYTHYLEAYEELLVNTKSVELANKNYNVISGRYSSEMALITDMLDAVNEKIKSETELTNAQINIIYYYYKLLFITGKL
ncbi:MAG: TolC family protein [Bacteroidales bacterium]|nr:TolC family protein [Bacteroidales bacterium]MDY5193998.1 TolC family protein [Candidatus Aphodosoma sp.]